MNQHFLYNQLQKKWANYQRFPNVQSKNLWRADKFESKWLHGCAGQLFAADFDPMKAKGTENSLHSLFLWDHAELFCSKGLFLVSGWFCIVL